MALRYYANAPATSLAASCTSGATSITVASVTGLPISYPYTLILDRGQPTEEVVEVTAAASTVLTVTRGVDGTTAFAHNSGASVEAGISARDVREPNSHINATNGVHGITGNVVGDTDAQTLTNKDVSDASNAFPASIVNYLVPTGVMLPFGGQAAGVPSGWLLCDGSAVSRTTYAALFAAIGTTHGAGDGSTTFNLPDVRHRVLIGAVDGAEATVFTTGATDTHTTLATRSNSMSHVHSHTISTEAAHSHTIPGQPNGAMNQYANGSGGMSPTQPEYNGHAHGGATGTGGSHSHGGATGSTIGLSSTEDSAHAFLAVNHIIKT